MARAGWLDTRLDAPSTVIIACAASLILGLIFVFVWSPLPWGWLGIDHYHDRAIRLAAGEPFDTTDVPWGYAYFLAVFYVFFGPNPAIPLVGQVALNALVPWLLYRLVRPMTSRRIAVLSALLVGVLSFNTVYAATQSADSVCTVVFLTMLLAFADGVRSRRVAPFVISGLLAGIAAQFRPNLILFPVVGGAAYLIARPRSRLKLAQIGALLAMLVLTLVPWTVRNYRLTGQFLPTSTHGGVQLWYGTLQVGPYLESRAYNPRAVFEAESFDYSSLAMRPIDVTVWPADCDIWAGADVRLIFWTDRNATRASLPAQRRADRGLSFEIPGQPFQTTIYYYAEARWPTSADPVDFPAGGAAEPLIFVVSADHLGNLDRHDDLVDIFDLIALVRAVAWQEPHAAHTRLDLDASGRLDEADVDLAVAALLMPSGSREAEGDPLAGVDSSDERAVLTFRDGSALTIPRVGRSLVTDLTADGPLAGRVIYGRQAWAAWDRSRTGSAARADSCRRFDRVEINRAFASRETHLMRRYTALAVDNIRRDPVSFAAASLYRLGRLFIIRGTSDRHTTQQFSASAVIYTVGSVASLAFFGLFIAGAAIAWRKGEPLIALLVPILYVPLTICFVLTNMRYTITVQPLMFAFVATALIALLSRVQANTKNT